jgi:serine/threonine protein kinase
MDEDYKDLAADFDGRFPDLGRLYDTTAAEPDEEEQRFLHPILNELLERPEHYADESFVVAGGEKRIYKVRDQRTDRIVALARPLEEASEDQKEQFLREARLTACLQHPNIMSIYDQGVDASGGPFFTMEFVHGDTLKDIIRAIAADDADYTGRFPLSRLLELFVKICDAVAYAHSRGVLHLDIKPANITIGPFGEALLCDWGLAKVFRNEPAAGAEQAVPEEELPNGDILNDLTQRGFITGTPGFMAPEQVQPNGKVAAQTDIYALGALLYFILTHRPPVSGDSMNEIVERTLEGSLVRPSKVVSGKTIPFGLEAVVMKALALDPADRYGTVAAFRDELDRYLMGFATLAQQAGWVERMGLLIKRRRITFNVSLFFITVLTAVIAASFVKILGEKNQAESARSTALENLRLYKQETDHSRALSDSIRATALDLINTEDFLNASGKIKAISSHLAKETDPENRQVLTEYLAMLHFVMQDFSRANTYFEQTEVRSRYLRCQELAREYMELKPDDDDWLEPKQMAGLLDEIKRHVRYVAYYMAHYYFEGVSKRNREKLLPVVEVMLDTLNNLSYQEKSIQRLSLSVNGDRRYLSLSGEPYTFFKMPIPVTFKQANVLHPLRLYSLDVSNSGITDIERLHGLAIEEINIAGLRTIERHKFYIFDRIKVKKVFHTLDYSDEYLKRNVPGVEFVRVEPDPPDG